MSVGAAVALVLRACLDDAHEPGLPPQSTMRLRSFPVLMHAPATALGAAATRRPQLDARIRDGVFGFPALCGGARTGAACARAERCGWRHRRPGLRVSSAGATPAPAVTSWWACSSRSSAWWRLGYHSPAEGKDGRGSTTSTPAMARCRRRRVAIVVVLLGRKVIGVAVADGMAAGLFFSISDISTKLATQGGVRIGFVVTLVIGYTAGTRYSSLATRRAPRANRRRSRDAADQRADRSPPAPSCWTSRCRPGLLAGLLHVHNSIVGPCAEAWGV